MNQPDGDTPCGGCASGTYAHSAIFNPESQRIAAGGELPRCKIMDRVCVGALDFMSAFRGATQVQKDAILAGEGSL